MIQNYDALTVGKYEAIQHALRDHAGDINRRNLAILSILTDKSEAELLDMPVSRFRALMDKASFLRRPLRAAPLRKSYTLGDMTLRPVADIQKITTAQYIDFQTLAQQPEEPVAQLVSCLLLPEGRRYNTDYDMADVHRAIRDFMLITEAQGLLAFFFETSRRSMLNTLRSSAATLKRSARKARTKRKQITTAMLEVQMSILLLRAGAGRRMSTPLLK